MPFAKTPHGKIHYNVIGEGEPVVLIRGLGRWSAHWHGWDHQLAKFCKVITYDNKGLGFSTSPMRPWHTTRELAADIALILKHERIDCAHIVGTSLGGMVAVDFALEHPELTKSLSVIAASIGRSGHMRISMRAAKLLISAPLKRSGIYNELAYLLTSPATADHVKQKLALEWRAEDGKFKQPIFTVFAQLLAAFRFRHWERLVNIKCPTQVIVGKDDLFVPRGNSLFLHNKISGSAFVEIPDAGHEPHIDQPETSTKIIRDFVESHRHQKPL